MIHQLEKKSNGIWGPLVELIPYQFIKFRGKYLLDSSRNVGDDGTIPGFLVEFISETAAAANEALTAEEERARVQQSGPDGAQSQTTLACTELAAKLTSNRAVVVCDKTETLSSVSIKRGQEAVSVSVYKRNTGDWGGYGLGTSATAAGSTKGVYVLIDTTGKIVTCVWHYHGEIVPETVVYNARHLSDRTYTLSTAGAPSTQTVSITVQLGVQNPLYAPTEEEVNAAACAALALTQNSASPGFVVCDPPPGPVSSVSIVSGAVSAQVQLYKYADGFWAGYSRIAPSTDSPTGVYARISGAGEVTCVWDSDTSDKVQKVVYTSTRMTAPSAAPSAAVVYTLASGTAAAVTAVVTLVHTSGPSPFPPVTKEEALSAEQKERELAKETSGACAALKTKVTAVQVRCEANGTPTIVSVARGTAVTALVKVYYDTATASWAGYGLSGLSGLSGAAASATNGVYVLISSTAQASSVKCVWDNSAAAPSVVEYAAKIQDRATRTYTLVETVPGPSPEPVSITVVSGQSPFPIEETTPQPQAPAPASSSGLSTEAIIGIAVGGAVGFLLIVFCVVMFLRSRKVPLVDPFRFML